MKSVLVLAAIGLTIWLGIAGIAVLARTTLDHSRSYGPPALVSTSFVDPSVGWAVGAECNDPATSTSSSACRSVVYGTVDGGKTWTTDSRILLTPRRIDFVDSQTGWLIGSIGQQCGTNICQNVIMLTQDGGKTWNRASTVAAELTDLAAVSVNDFWAVGHVCRTGQKCSGVLVHTTSGGQLWDNQELPIDGQDLRTARVSPAIGWVTRSDAAGGIERLALTRNGGATWESFPIPCANETALTDFSSAFDGWMVCSPAATSNVSMYRTRDAGATWQLIGAVRTNPVSTGAQVQTSSSFGSPTPVPVGGPARSLTVVSTGSAWIALASGRLMSAPGDANLIGSYNVDESPRDVRFVDPANGWLLGSRSIWRTVDGGRTWSKAMIVSPSGS